MHTRRISWPDGVSLCDSMNFILNHNKCYTWQLLTCLSFDHPGLVKRRSIYLVGLGGAQAERGRSAVAYLTIWS